MNLEFRDTELDKLREITKVLTTNGFLVDQAAEWEYALDAIPESIYIINKNHKIKFINKSLMNKLGIEDKNEVYDQNCFNVLNVPNKSTQSTCICELNASEYGYGEYYIENLGGWYKYNRSPIYTKSGKLLGYICILRNITERMLAEQDFQHSLNTLSSTFKAAPIGLGLISLPDRRFLMVNAEFCHLTGYDEEELIGRVASIIYPSKEEFERVGYEKYKNISERGIGSVESKIKTKSGKILDVYISTAIVKNEDKNDEAAFSMINITERKKNEDQLNFLLKLNNKAFKCEKELTQYALDEAVRISGSKIGYLHFISDDCSEEDEVCLELFTWSSKTMEICDAVKDKHYPLKDAGIWADCVREGKFIIHNDYETVTNKKGLPKGHVPLKNHMSVPIYDGKNIVAVIGVGNKPENYSEMDAKQLTVFGNHLWEILKAKKAQKKLEISENKFKTIFELSPFVITIIKFGGGIFVDANEAFFNLTGFNREDVIGKSVIDVDFWSDLEDRDNFYQELTENGEVKDFEANFRIKSGEVKSVTMDSKIIKMDNERYVLTITRGREDL